MNKIVSGFLGIALVLTVVGASAYAVYTSQATITGVSITSGSASLLIGNGEPEGTSSLPLNLTLNVYPGYNVVWPEPIYLHNASNGFDLKAYGQITSWSSTGSWQALADNVLIAVKQTNHNGGVETSWFEHTLREWHDKKYALPGNNLPSTGVWGTNNRAYQVRVRVPSTVDNVMQGQDLNNMVITLTGEQVLTP